MAVYLEEKETGQPGNTQGQATQLLAIMQALLKPPALSASGHERMVNGRTAVSGEKRLICPNKLPGSVTYWISVTY